MLTAPKTVTGPLDFYCANPECVRRVRGSALYWAGALYCPPCGKRIAPSRTEGFSFLMPIPKKAKEAKDIRAQIGD